MNTRTQRQVLSGILPLCVYLTIQGQGFGIAMTPVSSAYSEFSAAQERATLTIFLLPHPAPVSITGALG